MMELDTQREETRGVGQAPVQDALHKACAAGPGCDFTNPRNGTNGSGPTSVLLTLQNSL